MTPILRLRDVSRVYKTRKSSGWGWNILHAVSGVSLDIREGETLAIVGESGSGKSTLAKLLLMLQTPTSGDVEFFGEPLRRLGKTQRSDYRRQVQAVFQDPASSLDPQMTVEQTLGYIVRRHQLVEPAEQRALISRQLESVGLEPAENYLTRYPHQLSGGQQQRIAIARAMMLEPKVIVADEPLSSLDVSIQAQVLELMRGLRKRTNVGFVIISHDLAAMQLIAGMTAVMYRGRIVEIGDNVYEQPVHPYTRLLLDARLATDPRHGTIRAAANAARATPVASSPSGAGCPFRDRCPHAIAVCASTEPALVPVGAGTAKAACHRAEEFLQAGRTDRTSPATEKK